MRLFFELTRRSWQRYLTYRAAAVAGLITNVFFGMLRMAILLALYGEAQEVAGYTIPGIITYTAITQAVIAYLSMFGWVDLMNSVYSGEVAADLLKPMNYFLFWLAQDLGRAAVALLLRGVSIMLIYAVLFDLTYPQTAGQWLALAVAMLLSWLISFAWRFLLNLAAFWTTNAIGIGRFGAVLALFFSGFLMPLRFFPDWVTQVAAYTPFPYMVDTVVEVYLGIVEGEALLILLLTQLLWVVLLILLGQVVLKTAVRRLVIVGG